MPFCARHSLMLVDTQFSMCACVYEMYMCLLQILKHKGYTRHNFEVIIKYTIMFTVNSEQYNSNQNALGWSFKKWWETNIGLQVMNESLRLTLMLFDNFIYVKEKKK